jgi:hypothetical protein
MSQFDPKRSSVAQPSWQAGPTLDAVATRAEPPTYAATRAQDSLDDRRHGNSMPPAVLSITGAAAQSVLIPFVLGGVVGPATPLRILTEPAPADRSRPIHNRCALGQNAR